MFTKINSRSGKAVFTLVMLGMLVAIVFAGQPAAYAKSDETVGAFQLATNGTNSYETVTASQSVELNPTDVANPWKETSIDPFSFRGQSGFDDIDGRISKDLLKDLAKGF